MRPNALLLCLFGTNCNIFLFSTVWLIWNIEEFNPDPFMEQLNKQGLPWHEEFDKNLEL